MIPLTGDHFLNIKILSLLSNYFNVIINHYFLELTSSEEFSELYVRFQLFDHPKPKNSSWNQWKHELIGAEFSQPEFIQAIYVGNLPKIKYLLDQKIYLQGLDSKINFDPNLSTTECIEILNCIRDHLTDKFTLKIIYQGKVNLLDWAKDQNILPSLTNPDINFAGNLETCNWLYAHNFKFTQKLAVNSMYLENIELLDWCAEHQLYPSPEEIWDWITQDRTDLLFKLNRRYFHELSNQKPNYISILKSLTSEISDTIKILTWMENIDLIPRYPITVEAEQYIKAIK